VITPRITRLLRVADARAMHRAIAEAAAIPLGTPQPRRAAIVPTAGARAALRRTLQRPSACPERFDILTRDELYDALHAAAVGAPPFLRPFEREVMLTRAAEDAANAGTPPPFRLRPGLIAAILAFYDEMRRRDRTVDDFERLMVGSLESSIEIDRGAERMFRQTMFLAAAFRRFEGAVEASGRVDEHGLRRFLLSHDGPPAFAHVLLTIADQAADPRGFWTADYDLLARLPGLERIDVVATENVLAAGFHQRIHDLLPGIDEERAGDPSAAPLLVTPKRVDDRPGVHWFVCRDREEELAAVARLAFDPQQADRTAVVFQRPLPYLYLARHVFAAAAQPYQAVDSLPLAGEPFAAAIDVVFAFAIAEANRASTIDLLSSPHWRFPHLDATRDEIRERVDALDVMLRELKYLGGWDRLALLEEQAAATLDQRKHSRKQLAFSALRAAAAAAEALRPFREAPTASGQLRALVAFILANERTPDATAPWAERHQRARSAVLAALESLAAAHEQHDDQPLSPDRAAGAVRRWIEGQTFAPAVGDRGVSLLDAAAAPYADVDDLRVVGLVEHDWPERVSRNIFYPSSLLSQLGWPNEADRLAAARARFQDLLRLPRRRVSASTFTLEDDAIVSPSSFLEELETSALATTELSTSDEARMRPAFAHEALFDDSPAADSLTAEMTEWLALRTSRPADGDGYKGQVGRREPATYAVSHVERYIECPFKYFSARVLRLDEERDDESGLSPRERGQLLHAVFEAFFAAWRDAGRGSITAESLDEALALFESVAESTLARLPEGDRALERTYLLGSAAAAGLGERAFNSEVEQEVGVIERLIEHELEGLFTFAGADGPRQVRLRGKADRIDLLEDGTLRVIDYKLGRAPKPVKALQLPIYGVCAQQQLEGRRGRSWKVSRAGYVAFKEKNTFVALGAGTSLDQALEDGQRRLIAAVDGIERGDFPVRPEEPYLCTRCGFAGVCRKDYIGDE
jgi:RecB family exonuclease